MTSARFRFDAELHEYFDLETGDIVPHITGMLQGEGLIDDTWFTEESSERGTAVHDLTAEYDLGALDVASCVSRYRGYLLGHVAAMAIVRPTFFSVEEPVVHPVYKFGGRPDRVGRVYGCKAVLEVKSGDPHPSHQIQTALQAILVAEQLELPAESVERYAEYLKPNGRFKLEQHKNRRDFDRARRIIRRFCS